jgi:hypothetical protein
VKLAAVHQADASLRAAALGALRMLGSEIARIEARFAEIENRHGF